MAKVFTAPEKARLGAMIALAKIREADPMAERAIKGYIEKLEMAINQAIENHVASEDILRNVIGKPPKE
jgi:hypothetical protein